jgi:hypothetical protein
MMTAQERVVLNIGPTAKRSASQELGRDQGHLALKPINHNYDCVMDKGNTIPQQNLPTSTDDEWTNHD